jgi:hypothetical protein
VKNKYFQLCLALLLVSSALADKEAKKDEKVPLEKKLDKRGLLDLGYGYGINGLDVGYIGGGHYGGAYHSAPKYPHYGYGGYSSEPFLLGGKTDIHKTITHVKGIPVPYEVSFRPLLRNYFQVQIFRRFLVLEFFLQ